MPNISLNSRGYRELRLCATAQVSYRWCAGSSITKIIQPVSLGVRRVSREGKKEEGCRGILPFRRQALLRSRYAFFKATVLILESYGGLGDISKHDYKLPYFDIQRNIQKGLVGIGNRFAARARDWKEIQNAQG